jgi:hypothetical protein
MRVHVRFRSYCAYKRGRLLETYRRSAAKGSQNPLHIQVEVAVASQCR